MNVIPLDVQLFASRFAEQYSQFHGYDQDEARILFHRTRAMIHSKKNKCFRNGDVSVNFFSPYFVFHIALIEAGIVHCNNVHVEVYSNSCFIMKCSVLVCWVVSKMYGWLFGW